MHIPKLYPTIAGIIITALMCVETWLLMTVPGAADPFITFLTVGIIPGTDRRLTLEETYWFIGAVSTFVLVVTFHSQLSSVFHHQPMQRFGDEQVGIPARYVSAAKPAVLRRRHIEWRKVFELDRILVFAVRRGVRKSWRRMSTASKVWRARLISWPGRLIF